MLLRLETVTPWRRRRCRPTRRPRPKRNRPAAASSNGEAAVAAAAADRLRENAVGTQAVGRQRALGVSTSTVPPLPPPPPPPATPMRGAEIRSRHRSGDRKSAVAAAAANRLRHDGRGCVAVCCDVVRGADTVLTRRRSYTQFSRRTLRRPVPPCAASRRRTPPADTTDRAATVATAATNRLRENAGRARSRDPCKAGVKKCVGPGCNVAAVGDRDGVAVGRRRRRSRRMRKRPPDVPPLPPPPPIDCARMPAGLRPIGLENAFVRYADGAAGRRVRSRCHHGEETAGIGAVAAAAADRLRLDSDGA